MSQLKQERAETVKAKLKKTEPYFGWCDVEGCKNEGASGGYYWRETGYWTICSKHGDMARAKEPQPKMKRTAIHREKTRDKKTGFLPEPKKWRC